MNYFEVCEMKKLVDFKDDTINANVLLKNDKNMALLIAIKENQTVLDVTPMNFLNTCDIINTYDELTEIL